MPPFLKSLFELVYEGIFCVKSTGMMHLHGHGWAHAIDLEELVDKPTLMIRHMSRIVDPTQARYHLAIGNLLTYVFKKFQVLVGVGRPLTKKDMIDRTTTQEYEYLSVSLVLLRLPRLQVLCHRCCLILRLPGQTSSPSSASGGPD